MASSSSLAYRNIELSTEIRFLKHQLAEAEKNTLWLITHLRSRDAATPPALSAECCRAANDTSSVDPAFAHAYDSSQQALGDTAYSRCNVGKGRGYCCASDDDIADTIASPTPVIKVRCISERTCPTSFGPELQQRGHDDCIRKLPSVAECDHTSIEQERVREAADDLLTFSDEKEDGGEPGDETEHKRETESSIKWPPSTDTHRSELSDETSAPTTLSSSALLDSPIICLSPVLSPLTGPSTPTNSQFASIPLAENEDHTRGEWRALEPCSLRSQPKSPNRDLIFSTPFTDIEHNRLLGCAVFIESMNPSEAENFWRDMEVESFARVSDEHLGRGAVRSRNGGARGHVAEEWERYYLHVIRGMYLQRLKLTERGEHISEASEARAAGAEAGGLHEPALGLGQEGIGGIGQAGPELPIEHAGEDLVGCCNAGPSALLSKTGHSTTSSVLADNASTSILDLDACSCAAQEKMPDENLRERVSFEQPVYPVLPSSDPETPSTGPAMMMQGLGSSSDTLIDPVALTPSPAAQPESRAFLRRPPSQPRAFQPFDVSELFYQPTLPSAEDYRTVLVTNIPPAMTLATLLRKLQTYINILRRRETESESEGEEGAFKRGKEENVILSASLHPTNNIRTSPPMEGNTACIVFFAAKLAAEVVRACHAAADTSKGPRLDGPRLGVHPIPTPTRPCATRLREEIERGLSRVLYLAFPASASHAICGSTHEVDLEVSLDSKRAITTPSLAKPLLESLVASLSGCGIRAPIASGKLDRADGKQVLWFEFAAVRDAGLGWAAVGQWIFAEGEVDRGFLGEGEIYGAEGERELGVDVEREA